MLFAGGFVIGLLGGIGLTMIMYVMVWDQVTDKLVQRKMKAEKK